ncbi:uncharacterized protein LOC135845684 isoform X2 [Planococcus citri]|uniref:uncharacterized protein LOC135845684 isoform X2 n=1 Tax=Planococcus citri TaxID=170843 RepID=UPI0031F76C3B
MDNSDREEARSNGGYPLNYPTSPATLLQFSATRLALDLCNFKRMRNCAEDQFSCDNILPVALPTRIKKLIDERVKSVDRKLKKIYEHFKKLRTSSEDLNSPMSDHVKYFDSVSYGPDGSICVELTAKNLLTSDRLSQLEKFRIACAYCFEEDVKRIWSTISDKTSINNDSLASIDRLLIDYWSNRMEGNPIMHPEYPEYSTMLVLQCEYWSAFKYFWSRNSSIEQFPVITALLRQTRYKNAKHMLPKMNSIQLQYVSRHHAGDIITQLVWKEKYIDFVMQIWTHAKEFISRDQFLLLLSTLCGKSYKCVNSLDCDASAHVRMVLYEIWISAPNALKEAVFKQSNAVEDILKDLEQFDLKYEPGSYHHDMKFFLYLFKDMPFEMRNSLWLRYWPVFVVRYRAKFLNNFLELCMRKEDIPEFGETVMLISETIGNFLGYLFEQQFYEDVMDFLKICTSDENLIRKVAKHMIRSNNLFLCVSKIDKFAELSKFIDGCFANKDEIVDFKAEFYFSRRFQNLLISRLKYGAANDLVQITELFLYSEICVVYAKGKLLEYWRRYCLDSGNINFYHCKKFLSWCIFDSNNSPGSNCDFPVDKVFEILLMDAIVKLSYLLGPLELTRSEPNPLSTRKLDEFTLVDDFLTWYFVTTEAIKDYKLNKIRCRDVPWVGRVLRMKNECVMNDVLCWFFDADLDQVRCFKSEFTKSEDSCAEEVSKLTLE